MCTGGMGDPTPPPCCSCPPGCLDAEPYGTGCADTCTWCTVGCPEDGDPVGCCMEADPPPDSSLFHEDHPDHMPMGWPRPRSTDGQNLPTPYIARSRSELGNVEGMRRMLCVIDKRCQVCGEELQHSAVVCWGIGDAVVVDGAAICQRCWPSAVRLCPRLRELWDEGRLAVASMPVQALTTTSNTGLRAKVEGLAAGYVPPDYEPTPA